MQRKHDAVLQFLMQKAISPISRNSFNSLISKFYLEIVKHKQKFAPPEQILSS